MLARPTDTGRIRLLFWQFFVCLLTLFAVPSLLAQSAQSASIRGQVTDETGAIVPNATITLTGPGGVAATGTSSDAGAYSFKDMAPGDYTVQAAAPQLSLALTETASLKPGLQVRNLALKAVSAEQKFTVQEDAGPVVSTLASENASAQVITGDQLDALGDDPEDLQADLQALAGPSAGPNGGSIFIDGFSGGELPPKASIREIRVNQNPFSPEYDKLGFGRIEIFTKPGSDAWHGSMNYNYDQQYWNTRDPYSTQKAPLLLNEFEGEIGGRLSRHSSFHLDAQREKVDNGSISDAVTLDPATLAITPFNSIVTTPQLRWRLVPRVDYQLNANNTLSMRYGYTNIGITDSGIGSFDLISRGYHAQNANQTAQVIETLVFGTAVNETRFQYYRTAIEITANSSAPALMVLGAFNGGGAQTGRSIDLENDFELQNYTSKIAGNHAWKFGLRARAQLISDTSPANFGGTFTFGGGLAPVLNANFTPVMTNGQQVLAEIQPIERYQRALQLQNAGFTPQQAAALGGAPTQFTLTAGNPYISEHQQDLALFVGDDWKVRPNFTFSAGLRVEGQTNIRDHLDWAPRVGLAWAPAGGAAPKTVLRAGFGIFYDRFTLPNVISAERYNGIVEQQYVVDNPYVVDNSFYPNLPSIATLAGPQSSGQVIQALSTSMRAPYIVQSVFTVERQLPAKTTLAVTYANAHGLHELRSIDVNAPQPGTFNPAVPGSGVFPLGNPNPKFVMSSSGLYNQNQVIFNVNSRATSSLQFYTFYVINHAMSNTDGLGTSPANPYSFAGEYGPATTDVRQRVNLGGALNLRWRLRLNPYINIQSGAPFNITTGSDEFGTTVFNARPGIATNPNLPGLVQTKYGLLDPNPSPGETILGRNSGRGPGQVAVNLRIGKTWGFGEHAKSAGPAGPQGGPGGGGGAMAPPPTNGGGDAGAVSRTTRPYNITLSASFRNLTNHRNPGPIIGNIASPLFGEANQSSTAGTGGGGPGGVLRISELANNRRLEMQIRFQF